MFAIFEFIGLILLLVGGGILFAIIYPIVVASRVKHLQQRVEQLERQLAGGASVAPAPSEPHAAPQPAPAPHFDPVAPAPPPPPTQPVSMTPGSVMPGGHAAATDTGLSFIDWLKEDFMVKLGAFILLCAVGWFVSVAFANNWIGPIGRITFGLVLGIVFLLLGVWRIRRFVTQGSIFTVLGATIVLFTIFAARELYEFFTPATALITMFAAVVFVAFVSLRYDRQPLAIAGLLLGAAAPLFTAAPTPDVIGLFLYISIVVMGTLWVVAQTGWTTLTPLSLIVVSLYGLPFLESVDDRDVVLLFAFLYTAVFFVANMYSLVRRREDGEHRPVHIFTAAGTATYLAIWIYAGVVEHWQSLVFVAWAVVFAAGSYLVYHFARNQTAFYIYGGATVGLIAAATAAELEGDVLAFAFAFEIMLLLLGALYLRFGRPVVTAIAWLYSVPVFLALPSLINFIERPTFTVDYLLLLTLMVLLGWSAHVVHAYTAPDPAGTTDMTLTSKTLYVVAGIFALVLSWYTAILLFGSAGEFFALVSYAGLGIGLYYYGKRYAQSTASLVGRILIGLVTVRLLFVEVLSGDILTLFVVGLLLVSTAFIGRTVDNK